jgi:predicted dienelactone hydrolase
MFAVVLSPATSSASDADRIGKFEVGHKRVHLVLTGSVGEARPIDVEIWYPAEREGFSNSPVTVYRSRLWGVTLIPSKWDPLSWEITSTLAREGAPFDAPGPNFPVVLFSHGAGNSPLDYYPSLEHLASHGYVVASPWHTRNNQDDTRTNFVNQQAGFNLLKCLDGRPNPCMGQTNQAILKNRILDFNATLQALPSLFGDRVDVGRIGVMGHSAGAMVAVLAASGSGPLAISPIAGVDSVMTLSMVSDAALINQANLPAVTVPTLVVAAELDGQVPVARSIQVYNAISAEEKAFVILSNGVHRSFDAGYCHEMQAAGAVAQANPTRALLDLHTLSGALIAGTSGSSLEYCSLEYFTDPADIRLITQSLTGVAVAASNVPATGVSADEFARAVGELAVTFFDTTLDANGNDGVHFTQYLAPKWLAKHEPIIEHAEAESDGKVCPEGLDMECED